MRSSAVVSVALAGVTAVALFGAPGCNKTSGPSAAKEDMALVPKETAIVFMANLKRVRDTKLWRKMLEVRDADKQAKHDYDEFTAKCGLDPFKQIDSFFVAFPQTLPPAAGVEQKEFAAILRGVFDEKRLVACARDQAKKEGRELTTSTYQGKTLYSDTKGEAYATFLDPKTAIIGGKEWTKRVIDLAAGRGGESAKANGELLAIIKRTHISDGLWGAGIVSQATRDQFKSDPRLASAGSMKAVFGSVDFASGVSADLSVETGSEADAKDLASKATAQLADIKKNPQFMMMGLAQYFDSIQIDSKGSTFRLMINFNPQQVDDLINRVKGLLKSFGSSINPGGGPPPAPMKQ